MHPKWGEIFGSGGRAASAIRQIGGDVTLHTYLNSAAEVVVISRAALEGFILNPEHTDDAISFSYHHALSTPAIKNACSKLPPIKLTENNVIRFGMIEGDAIVNAEYAVYDPQNVYSPELFHANGSTANHLAVVLNRHEASVLSGLDETSPEEIAKHLSRICNAEIVVIKLGARGALVFDNGKFTQIPAFITDRVWKIGSGDNFVALFGYFWMEEKRSAADAAMLASKATAYYCNTQGFISPKHLGDFKLPEVQLSERYMNGYSPLIYLASPFFTLAELWLVDQTRNNLREIGLRVFSPYHEVGHGSAEDVVELDIRAIQDCDAVFAIGDSLDSGTIFEVGYARAINKPVIFYSENETEGNKKMMDGSGCILCDDYVTSIYKTLWTTAAL
jgi:hypothetical protein